MLSSLFRKKTFASVEKDSTSHGLHRILKVSDLVYIGVAGVIGAGMFSSIGRATFNGGPGISLLFVLIAVVCIFISLCYAEFASRIPLTGSSYAYAYLIFGELVAWIVAWALIIEYSLSNIIIAISWSSYLTNLLDAFHLRIPHYLTTDYTTAHKAYLDLVSKGADASQSIFSQAPLFLGHKMIMNVPAFVIVFLIGAICYAGIKESKNYSRWMVYIKIATLIFFVVVGFFVIDFQNYHPFLPHGFGGVMHGISAIFFAYIGFEAVSTLAEETIEPQKNLPKGMFYTILICSVVYIGVSLVLSGIVPYYKLNVSDPLAFAFEERGMAMVSYIISSLSLIASSSTLLIYQISQPRLWMNMSRDGLLPKAFSIVSARFRTPSFSTILTTIVIAIPTLFVEPNFMTEITSIGMLFTFALISFGVLFIPKDDAHQGFKNPYISSLYVLPLLYVAFLFVHKERLLGVLDTSSVSSFSDLLLGFYAIVSLVAVVLASFKAYSLIPMLSTLLCLYLMIEIPLYSWGVFFGWMALGLVLYFGYGYRKSVLRNT